MQNLILRVLLVVAVVAMAACSKTNEQPVVDTNTVTEAQSSSSDAAQATTMKGDEEAQPMQEVVTELVINDMVEGQGDPVAVDAEVTVHYSGWIYDPSQAEGKGEAFDSSVERGSPFTFVLGQGRVIRGWDAGVQGMKVGGKRRLIIPPSMAYGNQQRGPVIKPNSTLLFDVELLSFSPAG